MGNCCGGPQSLERPGLDVKIPAPQKVITTQIPKLPQPPKLPPVTVPSQPKINAPSIPTSLNDLEILSGSTWTGYITYESRSEQEKLVFRKFKAKIGDKILGTGRDITGYYKFSGKVEKDGFVVFK